MQIQTDISLRGYATMRLGGNAKHLITVTTKDELREAAEWALQNERRLLMLGGGSNIIFKDGFDGLVIVNRITGFEILSDDPLQTTIRIGAGENWDDVVARTVAMGLSGIEKLSAVPGTAGGTPVQNVGAYGAEIADTFVELAAYDLYTREFTTLHHDDCQFSYRNSIFKPYEGRHYLIANLTLRLHKTNPMPPFYDSLQRYLDDNHITEYTPQTVRDAVIAIRKIKLPDPEVIPNTGSFFKNPIVDRDTFLRLQLQNPTMPFYETGDGRIKLLAGWLIEHTGLKGYASHGMKVYEQNALVFVNETAREYEDLAAFREEVVDKVRARFNITLEQEPELV